MPLSREGWTLELLHALPDDGNRYELVDGELLVSPAPSAVHQRLLAWLFEAVAAYARTLGAYEALFAPLSVRFNDRRELQPDLMVWCRDAEAIGARVADCSGRLVLVVEVLSPDSESHDRLHKRTVYLEQGVPEYWIADPEQRVLERWRQDSSEPEVCTADLTWTPVAGKSPLRLDLTLLFRRAHREL